MKLSLFPLLLAVSLPHKVALDDVPTGFEFFNSKCDPSCIFEPYHIDSDVLKSFPRHCATVCGYLLFDKTTDVSEEVLAPVFENMRTLYGFLNIKFTNFKSVKFLEKLETIECESPQDQLLIIGNKGLLEVGMQNLTSVSCGVEIAGNLNMTKLELPNLKNFGTNETEEIIVLIPNDSPEFCFTVQEITNFFSSNRISEYHLAGRYCEFESMPPLTNIVICEIKNFSLTDFDTSCQRVFGSVLVRRGDERNVRKLENLTWIYGELLIHGTNLKTIDFLDNLENVISLRDYSTDSPIAQDNPAIQIYDNPNLIDANFPKLKNAFSFHHAIQFRTNHESLVLDPRVCFKIENQLNSTRGGVLMDWKTCGMLQSEKIARDVAEMEARLGATTQGGSFAKLEFPMALILVVFQRYQ